MISYNAWGTPSVTPGTDLEGLSVLWNGYYLDQETGNYYLRNRYYSPLERKFITDDPRGINPDENWNNPFSIKDQYKDGYGLQVYVQSDPVNNADQWGLWHYALPTAQRTKESRTFVVASSVWEMNYNIKPLAQLVRLNEEQFDKWGERATHKVNGIKKCGVWVANTAYVDSGSLSIKGTKIPNPFLQMELERISNHYVMQGYRTVMSRSNTIASINQHLSDQNIIAWGFVGHGYEGSLVLHNDVRYDARNAVNSLHHKLAQVILFACEAGYRTKNEDKAGYPSWKDLISRYGSVSMPTTAIRAYSDWEDLPTK